MKRKYTCHFSKFLIILYVHCVVTESEELTSVKYISIRPTFRVRLVKTVCLKTLHSHGNLLNATFRHFHGVLSLRRALESDWF